jgi:hypothetical protein
MSLLAYRLAERIERCVAVEHGFGCDEPVFDGDRSKGSTDNEQRMLTYCVYYQ